MQRTKRSAAKDGAGAGGSNILRGGKNTYSSRAKLGNWVEEEYRPEINTSNFSESRYKSTAFDQQDGFGGNQEVVFGAALPPPGDAKVDYENVIFPDRTNSASNWETVTQSAHAAPGSRKATEFSTTFKLTGGIGNQGQLDAYREKWTTETDVMRKTRFATENTITQGNAVAKDFKARTLRSLPGAPKVVETIRAKIIERGGEHGIRGIARSFRIMDDSNDKALSFNEFKYGIKDYGLRDISDPDLQTCFNYFDRDGGGVLDFDEFIRGVRGKLNQKRVNLIGLAFDKLDKTGNGTVELNDLQGVYNGTMHPKVLAGEMTEDEVLADFMKQWDTLEADGIVTFEEFCEYYKDVSCSIDDDEYFELMIRNAWKLDE